MFVSYREKLLTICVKFKQCIKNNFQHLTHRSSINKIQITYYL